MVRRNNTAFTRQPCRERLKVSKNAQLANYNGHLCKFFASCKVQVAKMPIVILVEK